MLMQVACYEHGTVNISCSNAPTITMTRITTEGYSELDCTYLSVQDATTTDCSKCARYEHDMWLCCQLSVW